MRFFVIRGKRGFLRDRSGASALEFAIVATPLIFLILGIFEIGLVYAGNFSLERTVAEAARWIRTGQAQEWNAAKFKEEVCKDLSAPLTCNDLYLDVRTFDTFGGAEFTKPLDQSGKLKKNFSYQPGTRNQVVIVRAFYEWPLVAKFPKDIALSNMANGNRLMVATAAFRNEPF